MKKLPTLHILNGDATVPAFEQASLPGQTLIWREILSEGLALGTLPDHIFWQKREQFITQTYQAPPTDYKKKVLDVVDKLQNAGAFFEVILWFDADLMCQINLLYLLHKLDQVKPAVVSVCTPEPGMNIGCLSPSALQQMFDNRMQQQPQQLAEATELWQLYAGPDPLQLQHYLQQHILYNKKLISALHLHLSRFPACGTGLGQPETILLQLIQQGATNAQELMQQFWQHYPDYGFSDSQLLDLLQRLKPDLIQEIPEFELTGNAKQLLRQKYRAQPNTYWLGGVKVDAACAWCFDASENKLVTA